MTAAIIAALIGSAPGWAAAVVTVYIWRRGLPRQTGEIDASNRAALERQTEDIKQRVAEALKPTPQEASRAHDV